MPIPSMQRLQIFVGSQSRIEGSSCQMRRTPANVCMSPNVPAIEPDATGAVTIRQMIEKHRADAACASCHAKMDPYGFALESFDVVGEYRAEYRAVGGHGHHDERKKVNGHPIDYHYEMPVDCAGTVPDGRAFADVKELRNYLAAEPRRLARAFTHQLLTYATGADVSFADRAEVEAVLNKTESTQHGLRSLVHPVVQSKPFQTK